MMTTAWKCLRYLALIETLAVLGLLANLGFGLGMSPVKVENIRGAVSYAGRPVTSGIIVFQSEKDPASDCYVGLIQPDGRFAISLGGRNDTLTPGRYNIYFRPKASSIPAQTQSVSSNDARDREAIRALEPQPLLEMPQAYYNRDTSNLWIDLTKTSNVIEIAIPN
jgi:hypothetical protein